MILAQANESADLIYTTKVSFLAGQQLAQNMGAHLQPFPRGLPCSPHVPRFVTNITLKSVDNRFPCLQWKCISIPSVHFCAAFHTCLLADWFYTCERLDQATHTVELCSIRIIPLEFCWLNQNGSQNTGLWPLFCPLGLPPRVGRGEPVGFQQADRI